MIILPAIDILDGKPVRLYQGDYGQSKCVADDVLVCAKNFEAANACYLHVVDLNGAKEGSRINEDLICEIVKTCDIPVEVGGGIRTMSAIDFYIENGVSRVILGTSAIQDYCLLKDAVSKYGSKIAVGLDCKDGYVRLVGNEQRILFGFCEKNGRDWGKDIDLYRHFKGWNFTRT